MDANITANTITFSKSFDEKGKGVRVSSARGINLPDVLTVANQDAVDSATKQPMRRFQLRVDRTNETDDGTKYVTGAYIVIQVPQIAAQADVDNVVATLRALVASTDPNYISQLLNSEV